MKTLIYPSKKIDGVYQAPMVQPFRGQYPYGYTVAFEEGDNVYLRRTTGDMGALRYKGLFPLGMISLLMLALMATIGTFEARVSNGDKPDHALIFAMIAGLVLFLAPAYVIIKHCLYPDAKEFLRWYHRDV